MASYTLSYTKNGVDGSGGWPSFYSFYPDWMTGMNNYFYSFKGKSLYRHNTGTRNNYYGKDFNSLIKTVFNDKVVSNKLWKAVALEGTSTWRVDLDSDQQLGYIEADWFKRKEGSFYGFVRNLSESSDRYDWNLRSVNGIGNCTSSELDGNLVTLAFDSPVAIGSIVSVGDVILLGSQPTLGGYITAIDIPNSTITYDYTAIAGGTVANDGEFIMYSKDGTAESHGVLGHYCVMTLTNGETSAVELFVVRSEVMKSFP